ncbi:murein hydrolase activator EnvC family protein [Bacteroidota bacterium]
MNKRIQLRNEIIVNIGEEVNLIDNEISQKNLIIVGMEQDLEKIRSQYAELIVQAYWNRSKRDWMLFVMSAENFNQAYRRMKYIQQFSNHRREQAELIDRMKNDIVQEIIELEEIKVQKEALVLEKKNENHALQREKNGKSQVVSELSKKEKELKAEINEKRRIADKLEKEIAAIIAEEARKSRSRNMYGQLTPEEKLISDNFQGNKGKIPWPVERGVITGKYGVHPHPILKQITVDNDGVDISTVKGASARAMFDGEVTKIITILGANYTIIIRHGNFLSVYQNLVDLKVRQGDIVSVKEELGTVYTDTETNSTVLHMQIWKEKTIQNPEEWISRQ